MYQQIIQSNLKTACLDFSKTNNINFYYVAGATFGKIAKFDWLLYGPESCYRGSYSGQYAFGRTIPYEKEVTR